MNRERLIVLISAIVVLLVTFVLGKWGYDDEVRDEKEYCEKVGNGTWPDYQSIYKEVCVDNPKMEKAE